MMQGLYFPDEEYTDQNKYIQMILDIYKCYELEVLRRFRDQWVSHHDNGEKEIGIYYEIAPKIVDKLRQHENSKEIYAWIYKEMIQKCVRYIENGDDEAAYQLYKEMSYKLKDYTDKI